MPARPPAHLFWRFSQQHTPEAQCRRGRLALLSTAIIRRRTSSGASLNSHCAAGVIPAHLSGAYSPMRLRYSKKSLSVVINSVDFSSRTSS